MQSPIPITSQKYYTEKLNSEAKVIRRYKANKRTELFYSFVALVVSSSACYAAVYFLPDHIPDFLDYLTKYGILSG